MVRGGGEGFGGGALRYGCLSAIGKIGSTG